MLTPRFGQEFSGDIKGLNLVRIPAKSPFLLASIARFLYPIGCLACERPPAVIWAGRMIRKKQALGLDSRVGRFSEEIMLVLR